MTSEPAAKKTHFDRPPEIKYTKILINNEWHDAGEH
jgi:ubiquitin